MFELGSFVNERSAQLSQVVFNKSSEQLDTVSTHAYLGMENSPGAAPCSGLIPIDRKPSLCRASRVEQVCLKLGICSGLTPIDRKRSLCRASRVEQICQKIADRILLSALSRKPKLLSIIETYLLFTVRSNTHNQKLELELGSF